jgi:hypothetical protein
VLVVLALPACRPAPTVEPVPGRTLSREAKSDAWQLGVEHPHVAVFRTYGTRNRDRQTVLLQVGSSRRKASVSAVPIADAKDERTSLTFLNRTYTLASHSRKTRPTWEFTTGGESIDQWTTLVTLIDRPEVKTLEQVDRLAAGTSAFYREHGAKVLSERTFRDAAGKLFDYLVVAFDEKEEQRYELDFVKIALGKKNAYEVIYGVRITDPDYLAKAKQFLDEHSIEVGVAVGEGHFPETSSLPRKEFAVKTSTIPVKPLPR